MGDAPLCQNGEMFCQNDKMLSIKEMELLNFHLISNSYNYKKSGTIYAYYSLIRFDSFKLNDRIDDMEYLNEH